MSWTEVVQRKKHKYNLRNNPTNGDPSEFQTNDLRPDGSQTPQQPDGSKTPQQPDATKTPQPLSTLIKLDNQVKSSEYAIIKAGDYQWIPKLKPNTIFRNWAFHVRNLGKLHIAPNVYPSPEQRDAAWKAALFHAALEANNNIMMDLIMGMEKKQHIWMLYDR